MDAHGYRASATPRAPDPSVADEPFIDLSPATCCARSTSCPSRAAARRGGCYQNYLRDVLLMRRGPLEDEGMEFSNPRAPAEPAEPLAA